MCTKFSWCLIREDKKFFVTWKPFEWHLDTIKILYISGTIWKFCAYRAQYENLCYSGSKKKKNFFIILQLPIFHEYLCFSFDCNKSIGKLLAALVELQWWRSKWQQILEIKMQSFVLKSIFLQFFRQTSSQCVHRSLILFLSLLFFHSSSLLVLLSFLTVLNL